jgi:hypothetical protein
LRRYKSPSYPGSEAAPQPLMLSFAQCADRQLFRCAEAPYQHRWNRSHRRVFIAGCRSRLTSMIRSWSCSAPLLGSALHAVQHVPRHQEISRKYHCPGTQCEPPGLGGGPPAEDQTGATSRVERHDSENPRPIN